MTLDVRPTVRPAATRPRRYVLCSGLVGLVLAVIWSPALVDTVIAGGIGRLLGTPDLVGAPIVGSTAAIVLAFVTGLAGTFTACNVAVFAALVPAGGAPTLRDLRRPLGLFVASAIVVSGAYGALAVLLGGGALQLSEERLGDPATGLAVRLLQAAIVFTLLGTVMVWRGLALAGVVDDRVSAALRRHPAAEMVLLGAMVGAFVIGRPYPPFRHLVAWAAETGDPLLGAAVFAVQSLGNVLILLVLVVAIAASSRGRVLRVLAAHPRRAQVAASSAFLVAGTFFVVYWGVRTLARAGLIPWVPLPWT